MRSAPSSSREAVHHPGGDVGGSQRQELASRADQAASLADPGMTVGRQEHVSLHAR
ncbi:hypothetical protein [Nocardioides astragali]|uniref:Uncharacterized protein n=1 Tax=Nocardioides astragali TaxID=1776736 RepID=A0ABW2N0K7_9ACTN|nr:hypothetical protein [Nocardioides astragali]